MNSKSFQLWFSAALQAGVGAVTLTLLLASCGGGGHNAGDSSTSATPDLISIVSGPDSFLLFPNPQSDPAVDSQTYTEAYYRTIDPNNEKDTIAKWKLANGFGSGTGSEVHAVFGDVRDLGYGRDMHGRRNPDGTLAFFVDNYTVGAAADYAYSSMNLDAAIAHDPRWLHGTNAIEISPGPDCTTPLPNSLTSCKSFAKFFTYDPVTGQRLLAANIDGRGYKSMPGICIECHGGRGDALLQTSTNATTGQPMPILFPIVGSPASGVRGDVKAKLHFFEPDSFDFSTLPGYTRADQEAAIKTLNEFVLCSYPLPNGSTAVFPEDLCNGTPRRIASKDEWQGIGAASVVKEAYGGNGLPNATYVDTYVPAAWVDYGHTDLYVNVVKPNCRVCHLLRGMRTQADIDFSTFTGFEAFADRIKEHVIDKGNMPLDRIINKRFWSTPIMYNSLAQFLQSPNPVGPAPTNVTFTVTDNTGAILRPGRPIAVPGPDRAVAPGSTTLSAAGSWFADTFTWTIVSMPPSGDGSLNGFLSSSGSTSIFNATVAGAYQIKLEASKGAFPADTKLLTIVVVNPWPLTMPSPVSSVTTVANPLPANIRFSNIKAVL